MIKEFGSLLVQLNVTHRCPVNSKCLTQQLFTAQRYSLVSMISLVPVPKTSL